MDEATDTFDLLKSEDIIIGKHFIIKAVKLAKNGDSEAQYNLELCYQNEMLLGKGINKDETKAFE
ncbi:hypothetical protein C1645_836435 [Glomus cerebriforme]|uniref:Uncharacterized protein n=1 Tax=Glomus cerebriforme TaxID=658196 RepID=A0A397S701_9GLOM|nr:hypothetical protein C1645_836435 [Glomus cerebriforme]